MAAEDPLSAIATEEAENIDNNTSSRSPDFVSNVQRTANFCLVGKKAAVGIAKVQNWQSETTGWSALQLGNIEEREQELEEFLQRIDRVMKMTELQAAMQDGNDGAHRDGAEEGTEASARQVSQVDIALQLFGGAGSCTELPN